MVKGTDHLNITLALDRDVNLNQTNKDTINLEWSIVDIKISK